MRASVPVAAAQLVLQHLQVAHVPQPALPLQHVLQLLQAVQLPQHVPQHPQVVHRLVPLVEWV